MKQIAFWYVIIDALVFRQDSYMIQFYAAVLMLSQYMVLDDGLVNIETSYYVNWFWLNHPWRQHANETLSALLALCEGNPVTSGLPHKKPVMQNFDVLFDVILHMPQQQSCNIMHYFVTISSIELSSEENDIFIEFEFRLETH